MKRYLNIMLILLVWIFSVVNTSGLGQVYETPTKTNIMILVWLAFVLYGNHEKLHIGGKNAKLTFFTVLSFIIVPYIKSGNWEGFTYLLMIPLVYCFSQQRISQFDMRLSGYIIAGLGIGTLYIYSRTSILSGWNDNQIGMIGLFSYLYYAITLFGKSNFRKISIGAVISIVFISLLIQHTASRSIAVFALLACVVAYSKLNIKGMIKKKRFVFFALNVPLIIAIFVVLFPNIELFQMVSKWSEESYRKTAFNGRDELWLYTFNHLLQTYFIGDGKFLINHHNSAMAALGVFGVVGYICWYKLLAKPVRLMVNYVDDAIVYGCLISFLLIFWQQSFDLGFISPSPNMIPYAILGIGLGRIKTICSYGKD